MLMLTLLASDPSVLSDLVVAHYNHKMRPSSDDDARFVRKWAEKFDVPFYTAAAEPGEIKSEEQARALRYEFLRNVAEEVGGEIWTAHHVNDLVESVAINFARGTGWRGLVPFSDKSIRHFFLESGQSKSDVLKLASKHEVVFRQDQSNTEDVYLRNRMREKLSEIPNENFHLVYDCHQKQIALKNEIDKIVADLLPADGRYERAWFSDLDDKVALEILRAGLLKSGTSATRPQIMEFLSAIRTYASHKKFNLPGDKLVTLYKDYFVL